MSLVDQIGAFAGIGSLMLSRPATLRRGLGPGASALASRIKANKPYRANENRRPFDAELRLNAATAPFHPAQNDEVDLDGDTWIVWRILPSPAGSHWTLECMAPPTVGIIPIEYSRQSDGMGGEITEWVARPDLMFYGKTREASIEGRLTAEAESTVQRLALSYPSKDEPEGFGEDWRVAIEGLEYEILSVSVDDENPFWRNAILVRRGAA